MDELYQQYKLEAKRGLEIADNCKASSQSLKFTKALSQIENSIHKMQLEAAQLANLSYKIEIEDYRRRYLELLHSDSSNKSMMLAAEPLLDTGFKHLSESKAIVEEVNTVNAGVLGQLSAQRETIGKAISRLVFQGEYMDRADAYLTKLQINRNLTRFVWKFITVLAVVAVLVIASIKLL